MDDSVGSIITPVEMISGLAVIQEVVQSVVIQKGAGNISAQFHI